MEYSLLPERKKKAGRSGLCYQNEYRHIADRNATASNDRIMTMILPLSKDNFATIISVYVSTMANPDENREAVYHHLASVISGIPRADKLLIVFNTRIGREPTKWTLVMGKCGIGKCNSNGELLLALCSEFELIVTNSMFTPKDEYKTTWMHPRSKHWHMIDFIITRCRDKMYIHSTRTMHGALSAGPMVRC